jgi:class I fructose-bisphosphate aldolase
MSVGKEIRLSRLLNQKSGRLLAITMDHPITRGVLPGLENISDVLKQDVW